MTSKRLYRPRNDRMIAGVCAGIGSYLNIDPTIVRLAILLLAVWGGGGILAYLIAWVVIPEEPLAAPTNSIVPATLSDEAPATSEPPASQS